MNSEPPQLFLIIKFVKEPIRPEVSYGTALTTKVSKMFMNTITNVCKVEAKFVETIPMNR